MSSFTTPSRMLTLTVAPNAPRRAVGVNFSTPPTGVHLPFPGMEGLGSRKRKVCPGAPDRDLERGPERGLLTPIHLSYDENMCPGAPPRKIMRRSNNLPTPQQLTYEGSYPLWAVSP